MWPFKKKEAKPVEPNYRLAMIEKMQEWRSVGEEFEYLGHRMIVTGHWRIVVHGFPGGLCVEPCLRADYADNNGVIHSVSFSIAASEALMRAHITPNFEDERMRDAVDEEMSCDPECVNTEIGTVSASSGNSELLSAAHRELGTNIRRNMKHMMALLEPGNDRDSQLIDIVLHVDALAQQIEGR